MKTKTLLLICLFIGMGLTQLSAQNGKNGTGTITGSDKANYDQPIYHDGVLIDRLIGTIEFHYALHFKNGEYDFVQNNISGEVASVNSPFEVFKVHEIDKSAWEEDCIKWHFNLIGNMGTHYIGFVTWNFVTNETTYDKIVVPGSKK